MPAAWDVFVPEGHFLKSDCLGVTERSELPGISYIYVLVWEDGEITLASAFQVLQMDSRHLNRKMVAGWQHTAWSLFTTFARPKLLVSGHLFRHDISSVYYPEHMPAYRAYRYFKMAIDRALQISCIQAVLVKDAPESFPEYFLNFSPEYILLRNDILMEMDISKEWNSIDDYEEALKHKYAQRYRKIRQPWNDLDIKELDEAATEASKELLYSLYLQVTEHQQVRIGFLSADFIPELKRNNDRLKIWGIYDRGIMIGFFSAWVKHDALDMFYIGFDYEKNKEYNLYFNILFFSIEQAILHKKEKLILGRTALDAKARLGCRPRYLHTFLYIRNRWLRQRILQVQKNTSDKEGAWEARHPLKGSR